MLPNKYLPFVTGNAVEKRHSFFAFYYKSGIGYTKNQEGDAYYPMPEEKKLSRVAEKYLHRYDEILRKMILDMNAAPVTGSISANFIRQMLPHHKAAIELAQNLLLYTTCLWNRWQKALYVRRHRAWKKWRRLCPDALHS